MPKKYGTASVTKITKIIDGDTFKCDLMKWPPIIGLGISVKIRGFNASKIGTSDLATEEKAMRARLDLGLLLSHAARVELHDIERGSHFRLIATVLVDGKDVAIALRECLRRSQIEFV